MRRSAIEWILSRIVPQLAEFGDAAMHAARFLCAAAVKVVEQFAIRLLALDRLMQLLQRGSEAARDDRHQPGRSDRLKPADDDDIDERDLPVDEWPQGFPAQLPQPSLGRPDFMLGIAGPALLRGRPELALAMLQQLVVRARVALFQKGLTDAMHEGRRQRRLYAPAGRDHASVLAHR